MDKSTDVSLLIDGQTFNVRKDMLSEFSDYFRAMFSGNYVEKEQQEISIDVVDANSMIIILRYMEMGLVDLTEYSLSTIGDLAIAANFLQITELMKQIEYSLEQQLSLSNWIEIMEIANNASSAKLEQFSMIHGLFSFNLMKPHYIPTLHKLYWYLSHPYLNTESELHVFKFGLQWITHAEMGADVLLILLCCLDLNRLKCKELKEIKDLIKDYVNSLAEKVVDCLYKLSTDSELSLSAIKENKPALCESYTGKVYSEVLNLVEESIERKLKFTPAVPLWSVKDTKPETSPHYMSTFTEEKGFERWLEVAEKNLWGWNVASWGPTKVVVVSGEHGRGTGIFMRDVKVYDILKKEWIRHGVKLPSRRHGGSVIVQDSLFIIGGVGGFRVMLDRAIIYDLKQRTFRRIANFPDAIQCPAVCSHDNVVYAAGYKNIYKYEDFGEHDRWSTVLITEIRPNCLVSYKGYIYVTQSFFNNLYRFRPDVDTKLEMVSDFSNPPVAVCNLGDSLLFFTSSGCAPSNIIAVEEYNGTKMTPDEKPKVLWSQMGADFDVNNVAGLCSVVLTMPPVNPRVSPHHKRYLSTYKQYF